MESLEEACDKTCKYQRLSSLGTSGLRQNAARSSTPLSRDAWADKGRLSERVSPWKHQPFSSFSAPLSNFREAPREGKSIPLSPVCATVDASAEEEASQTARRGPQEPLSSDSVCPTFLFNSPAS